MLVTTSELSCTPHVVLYNRNEWETTSGIVGAGTPHVVPYIGSSTPDVMPYIGGQT